MRKKPQIFERSVSKKHDSLCVIRWHKSNKSFWLIGTEDKSKPDELLIVFFVNTEKDHLVYRDMIAIKCKFESSWLLSDDRICGEGDNSRYLWSGSNGGK